MAAEVVISIASGKHIIYHRPGCPYARRIKIKNKLTVRETTVQDPSGFCACKYCRGLGGDFRTRKGQLRKWAEVWNMTFRYEPEQNRFYMRTVSGFWMVYEREYDQSYLLYHLNHFTEDASMEALMQGPFHRQKDVVPGRSLEKLVRYADQHDRAKQIIEQDYRGLPRRTKKQKKYYKQAERRAFRSSVRRMDSIFDALEAEWKKKEMENEGKFIGQGI